jgi:FkbM family methyltransferase
MTSKAEAIVASTWRVPRREECTGYGDSCITGPQPVCVVTAAPRWSYAVSVPFDPPTLPTFVIEAELHVKQGTIGVSSTSRQIDHLTHEALVSEGQTSVIVQLFAQRGDECLLIRNGPEDRAASCELRRIRWRQLTNDECFDGGADLRPVAAWHRFYGTAETIAERRREREYSALNEPTPRAWFEGLTVMLYPSDQLSRALHVSGAYEPNTAIVLRRLLPDGGVFVDVGAHAGIFTMLASRWVGARGRVISFEPSARERARLLEHVDRNSLTNVTVHPEAVADREGTASLKVAADGFGGLNTIGSAFAYDVPAREQVDVPVTTLDRALASDGIQQVHAIKLDAEGAEYAALVGARGVLSKFRPALVLELFSRSLQAHGVTIGQLAGLLHESGYRTFRIDDATARLEPLNELEAADEQNIVALPQERVRTLAHHVD